MPPTVGTLPPKRSLARAGSCVLLFWGLAASPSRSLAQQVTCPDAVTLVRCYVLQREPLDSAFAAANRDREEEALAGKTSGAPAVGGASAIDDFLPLLAGSLGLTPVESDEDGALALETNLGLPTGVGAHQRFRVRATMRTARVYEPLASLLASDVREQAVRDAEGDLGDLEDVEIGVAWSVESPSVGRSFRNYQVLYGRLLDDALGPALDTAAEALTQTLVTLSQQGSLANCDPDAPTIGCLPPDERAGVVDQIQALAESDALFGDRAAAVVSEYGLDWFGRLVNNQPQISVSATGRLRHDEVVGPNIYGLAIRYEHGLHNVNRLRGYCADSGSSVVGLDCLRAYLDQPGVRPSIDRGDRLWASARFEQTAAYRATLDTVTLDVQSSWDVVAELGYGRYLGTDASGDELGRIDVSFEGHLVNDQTNQREDRLVGKVDLSRRVANGASLVFGVTVANKPAFIGEEGKRVLIRAGLRYGLH